MPETVDLGEGMQSVLKAMNRDLQGLWSARLARDPSLYLDFFPSAVCLGTYSIDF